MSSLLNHRHFSIGRSARMLASQCPERILRQGLDESVRSMFFRALLQLLSERHGTPLDGMDRVGKISVIGIDFVQYLTEAKKTIAFASQVGFFPV